MQEPPPMRKYQGDGPLVSVRLTARLLSTVAARLVARMVNVVAAISVLQLLLEYAFTEYVPGL